MQQPLTETNVEEPTERQGELQPNEPHKLIIVSGFGPFIGHEKVNASWEAVRLLPDVLDFKGTQYVVEKKMVPVEYAAVDQAVKEIWARKPELVIHCGVHGLARCVHVEKLAYNHKFKRCDYKGKRLPKGSARLVNSGEGIGNDVIRCRLNVDKIVSAIAESCRCTVGTQTPTSTDGAVESVQMAKVSYDVGNYLCGYIYLKSLDMNKSRSLFVHVPPIDKPFSSAESSEVILKIIDECVRQVVEDMKETC